MFELYYGITSVLLGVALFFPVKRFMLASSANRLAGKLKRVPTDEEIKRLERRVVLVAAVVSLTFAFVFNKVLLLRLMKG